MVNVGVLTGWYNNCLKLPCITRTDLPWHSMDDLPPVKYLHAAQTRSNILWSPKNYDCPYCRLWSQVIHLVCDWMQACVLCGDGVPVLALEWLSDTAENLCVSTGNGLVSLYNAGIDRITFHKSVSMKQPITLLGYAQQRIFCGSVQGDISVLEQVCAIVSVEWDS